MGARKAGGTEWEHWAQAPKNCAQDVVRESGSSYTGVGVGRRLHSSLDLTTYLFLTLLSPHPHLSALCTASVRITVLFAGSNPILTTIPRLSLNSSFPGYFYQTYTCLLERHRPSPEAGRGCSWCSSPVSFLAGDLPLLPQPPGDLIKLMSGSSESLPSLPPQFGLCIPKKPGQKLGGVGRGCEAKGGGQHRSRH